MINKIAVIAMILLVTGCATFIAPKYNTDFNNISPLRKEKLNPVRVGQVTKNSAVNTDVDSLTIRGGGYLSPYGSFTAYLSEALKQELEDARLFNPTSQIEISAILLRNLLNTGISTGVAEIEAKFTVRKGDEIKYEKTKIAQHTWDSSYSAYIAVPKTQQNYPVVVQKLLGLLFSDPEFISALR